MTFIKNNKYIFLIFLILIIIILLSFYNVHNERFGYVEGYNEIKEKCTGENDTDKICRIVPTKEALDNYLDYANPQKIKDKLDPIYLTSEVIFDSFFFSLQFLGPLLIIFATTFTLSPYFNSMIFKDYYIREGEKDLRKEFIKKSY